MIKACERCYRRSNIGNVAVHDLVERTANGLGALGEAFETALSATVHRNVNLILLGTGKAGHTLDDAVGKGERNQRRDILILLVNEHDEPPVSIYQIKTSVWLNLHSQINELAVTNFLI